MPNTKQAAPPGGVATALNNRAKPEININQAQASTMYATQEPQVLQHKPSRLGTVRKQKNKRTTQANVQQGARKNKPETQTSKRQGKQKNKLATQLNVQQDGQQRRLETQKSTQKNKCTAQTNKQQTNTQTPMAPIILPWLRRFFVQVAKGARAGVAKLLFLFHMMPLMYRLYPDARYLAAKRPPNAAVATQLGRAADGFSGMAKTMDTVYQNNPRTQENFNWVVDAMQEHLCNNCVRRAHCWGNYYSDLMDGLFALKPILETHERVGVEHFTAGLSRCVHPAAMASEMTRAYAIYRGKNEARVQSDALRTALLEQYSAVAQALESLGAQIGVQGQPEPYKTCRVIERLTALGLPPSECAVTQEASGQLRVAVTVSCTGFTSGELQGLAQEVSRICRHKMQLPQKLTCRGITTLIFLENPPLSAQFGVACQAAKGSVSGDAVQQFCRTGTAEMILCDGMGTGQPAAVDGSLAAELTARLLKANFTAETAARLVNIALSLKSEAESSATLDLLSVDLYTGITKLFKAGAAPGFIAQGSKAFAIEAASLPVGILTKVQGAQTTLRLQAGDVVVLVSDGVLAQGEEWVVQHLAKAVATGQPAQNIAEQLLRQAKHGATNAGCHPDDMTVAVLRLCKTE